METEQIEILKKCANDLIYFGKKITPKKFYLKTPKFHEEIGELLMDRSITQLVIQAPRGFAKSTLSNLFILHHCIFDPGDKVVIIQSKTRSEAINRLTTIKNILNYGTIYRNLFGYSGEEVATTWREDKIKTTIGGFTVSIRAIGTGMPVRGTLESGFSEDIDGVVDIDDSRITLYFLDDPDDEDNTITLEQMDKNFSKFIGGKEGLDKRLGRVLVIGTPITKGCIVDRISSNPTGWVSRTYQAYWDDNEGKRKFLWTEMRDQEWLDNKKKELRDLGKLSKFYSEYMCQLRKGEDVFFKGYHTYKGNLFWRGDYAYLRVMKIDEIELPEPKVVPVKTFMGIDPASSSSKDACFSVTFSIAYSSERDIFCLPYYRRRVPPSVHADQIIESIKQFKYSYGSVETVNYQLFLKDYLVKKLREEDIYLRGLNKKWNPHSDKTERLETMEPFFATGHMYILEDMDELIDEMEMFPDGTKDILDGLYYSTRKLILPDHTNPTETINYLPYHENEEEIPQSMRWMN